MFKVILLCLLVVWKLFSYVEFVDFLGYVYVLVINIFLCIVICNILVLFNDWFYCG